MQIKGRKKERKDAPSQWCGWLILASRCLLASMRNTSSLKPGHDTTVSCVPDHAERDIVKSFGDVSDVLLSLGLSPSGANRDGGGEIGISDSVRYEGPVPGSTALYRTQLWMSSPVGKRDVV